MSRGKCKMQNAKCKMQIERYRRGRFAFCILRFAFCIPLLFTAGCDMLDMYDEPRFEPLEASTFFEDGTSARPLMAGTVARGDLRDDEAFYSGKVDGKYLTELPLELTGE